MDYGLTLDRRLPFLDYPDFPLGWEGEVVGTWGVRVGGSLIRDIKSVVERRSHTWVNALPGGLIRTEAS